MRIRLRGILAVTALTVAAIITTAVPANAATVPNFYDCSIFNGRCVQTNGPHVNGLPNGCRWVVAVISGGSPTSICTYWR